MATSTIDNPNKVTTVNLSINTDGATGSGTIVVSGRVATISALINSTGTGADRTLAWIPDAANPSGIYEWIKPLQSTWLSCNYYHSSGEQEAEARMLSTGYLNVSTPIANKDLKICGAWITKG